MYDSELKELDKLNVIRMSIGVGTATDCSVGSALWMIDNNPDDNEPLQIDSADDLNVILTNLCVPAPPSTIPAVENPAPSGCSGVTTAGAINIGIVVDTSGSTVSTKLASGSNVGDINSDGKSNTILDAEINAVLKLLDEIATDQDMTNNNVKIGLISFDSDGVYHGMYSPLNSSNNGRNRDLETKLKSLKSTSNDYKGYTNFDDGLDKSIEFFTDPNLPKNRKNLLIFLSDGKPNVMGDGDVSTIPNEHRMHFSPSSLFFLTSFLSKTYFSQDEEWCPTRQSCSYINKSHYKLTDDPEKPWEKGALSFCMPGHSNKCERNKIECARNNGRSPGGCLGANAATNYVSELKKLDELMVARMAIGVGGGSETTNGSALWMIDNSPDKSTIDPAQVFDNDDLVTAVTSVNVCAEVSVADPTLSPTNKPTRAPTKAPTPSPTDKPTRAPTKAPTPSPTNNPTPGPTNKPTMAPVSFGGPSLTELGKEGGTGGVSGPVTPDPSCSSDIVLVRKIGGTSYGDNTPIAILSQNPNEVTFQLSQEWKKKDNLDHLFVRFRDTYIGSPHCHAFQNISATWTSDPFTAVCTRNSKVAMVEVWASHSTFDSGLDIAEVPGCSCDAPADGFPMVKYQFLLECVSTCPEDCPSGRMLGSEL
jgi:hypothetical protein